MVRIVVVDNVPEAAAFIRKLLVAEGYDVDMAHNADDARAELASKTFDVAIIDLHLRSSGGRGDRSGLDLALSLDPLIPKIIVSSEADREDVMAVVRASKDGFAAATAFLEREGISIDKPDLVNAVRRAIDMRRLWMRQSRNSISEQLAVQYREVQREAAVHNRIQMVVNAIFATFMIVAALSVHRGILQMLFTMIAVVAGEVTNIIIARGKGEALNIRAERQHTELLQAKRFEQLLSACDTIANAKEAERVRVQLLLAATGGWIGGSLRETQPTLMVPPQIAPERAPAS
jgi:CheY-like chemotaxis protein